MAVDSPPALGPVSTYVRDRLAALLDERRVVVWYDRERAFAGLLEALARSLPHCAIVPTTDSQLRARRDAEAVYRSIGEADETRASRRNLLLYVPAARGATAEEQARDPFEAFARCGAAFGDNEGERLDALARLALPEAAAEIE